MSQSGFSSGVSPYENNSIVKIFLEKNTAYNFTIAISGGDNDTRDLQAIVLIGFKSR